MTVRVLALADYYPPSQRGGAGRCLWEIVEQGDQRCSFHVRTRDHDALTGVLHEAVSGDTWDSQGKSLVKYASAAQLSQRAILGDIEQIRPNAIYLNSLFAGPAQRVLWGRWRGLISAPVLLAPEGELSPGALAVKYVKKQLYLTIAEKAGLYRGINWRAATALEAQDIRTRFPGASIVMARSPARSDTPPVPSGRPAKRRGHVKLLYLSRIDRKKNLVHLLEALEDVEGEIDLSIVGTIDDPSYWIECQRIAASLPTHVRVSYAGEAPPADVWRHYAQSHVFVLPTRGENYGYVIAEALSVGVPVLISDATPWRHVERDGAGWVVPLEDGATWREALQRSIDLDQCAYDRMSIAAACAHRAGAELPTLCDALVVMARTATRT